MPQNRNPWLGGPLNTSPQPPKIGQPPMGDPTWDQGGIEDFIRNTVLDQNPDWDSALQESTGTPSWRVGQQEYTDDAIYQEGEWLREQAQMNEENAARFEREQEARELGLELAPALHEGATIQDEVFSVPGLDTVPWNPPQPPGVPFGAQPDWFGGWGLPKPKKLPTLPTG